MCIWKDTLYLCTRRNTILTLYITHGYTDAYAGMHLCPTMIPNLVNRDPRPTPTVSHFNIAAGCPFPVSMAVRVDLGERGWLHRRNMAVDFFMGGRPATIGNWHVSSCVKAPAPAPTIERLVERPEMFGSVSYSRPTVLGDNHGQKR